jgi:hypothetical protein
MSFNNAKSYHADCCCGKEVRIQRHGRGKLGATLGEEAEAEAEAEVKRLKG